MKCDDFFHANTSYITLWPWPLTTWPWTFVVVWASCLQTLCKIWAKSNNPLQSYWRYHIIAVKFLRGPRFHESISGVRGPNFTKLGENVYPSSLLTEIISELRYLAAFSNAGRSKSSYVENDAKFRTFWPPVKLGDGWARSLGHVLKLYLRPNLVNRFDGRPLCHFWEKCITKKKKKETRKRVNC